MADPRHLEMLVRLHPRGPFDLDDGSTFRADLAVLAAGLDLADDQRLELLDEVLPDRAEDLLSSWERVYDRHRIEGRSVLQRRAAVLARRRFLPDFRASTFVGIFRRLTGVDTFITEPGHFRCDDPDSRCDEASDVLDGTFVFFVDQNRDAAEAASVDRNDLDEVIGDAKPAHVYAFSRFVGNFCCDDPYSLLDRDLLGG